MKNLKLFAIGAVACLVALAVFALLSPGPSTACAATWDMPAAQPDAIPTHAYFYTDASCTRVRVEMSNGSVESHNLDGTQRFRYGN